MVLDDDFEVNDVEMELNQINSLSVIRLEDDKFKNFIKMLDKFMTRKHLIATS